MPLNSVSFPGNGVVQHRTLCVCVCVSVNEDGDGDEAVLGTQLD